MGVYRLRKRLNDNSVELWRTRVYFTLYRGPGLDQNSILRLENLYWSTDEGAYTWAIYYIFYLEIDDYIRWRDRKLSDKFTHEYTNRIGNIFDFSQFHSVKRFTETDECNQEFATSFAYNADRSLLCGTCLVSEKLDDAVAQFLDYGSFIKSARILSCRREWTI